MRLLRLRLQTYTAPPDLKNLEKQLEDIRKEKEEAVANQNFEKAAQLRDRSKKVKEEIEAEKDKMEDQPRHRNRDRG